MSVLTPAPTPAKLKRSRSDLEASVPVSTPTSGQPTAKRPRVQFTSENTVHMLRNWDDEKTPALIREEVRRAIEKHLSGDSTPYNALCELISLKPSAADALTSKTLKRYIVAITGMCRTMERKCPALVSAITRISWLGRDNEFVKLYQNLLTNLITTYGGYTSTILLSLITHFTTVRPHHGKLPHEERVTKSSMLDRVHHSIEHILQKVPSAVNQLQTELRQDFPHPSDSYTEHMDYVTNLLRVTQYAPHIKADLVAMIFDKVTVLDAQMQTDIEALQEELEETYGENLSLEISNIIADRQSKDEEALEEDDTSDSDDESEIDEFEDEEQRRIHNAKQEIAKLDGLMTVLFDHFGAYFNSSNCTMEEQFATLDQLFGMFARMVLTTEKSRFIQFLLFHFALTTEELSERFVDALINVLGDINADRMMRRAAASYLASFISRAGTVSRDLIKHTFYTLGKELDRLRATHEKNERLTPDLSRYGQYYNTLQCLMYIFCFRWRDLLVDEVDDDDFNAHELIWLHDIADIFRRNIPSRLNPLKVCSPTIVRQFLVVCNQLQFLYFDHIVQQNKRIRLTRSMANANGGFSIIAETNNNDATQGEAHLQLGAYFPFDPYRLPLSKTRIEGQYNMWRPVPGVIQRNLNADGEADFKNFDEESAASTSGEVIVDVADDLMEDVPASIGVDSAVDLS